MKKLQSINVDEESLRARSINRAAATRADIIISNPFHNIDFSSLSENDISCNLDIIKNAIKEIDVIEKRLKDEAHKRLSEGKSIKGYDLIEKTTVRKIKDINELFNRLKKYNIDAKMFMQACNISIPNIEKTFTSVNKSLTELKGGKITKKQLAEDFKRIIEDLMDEGTTTTYVKKI